MDISTIKKAAAEFENRLLSYRRYLHENPELSFEETNTSRWIREKLAEFHIPIMAGIRGNSVVGILKGSAPGPVIGFRADMDALPIHEDNGLPFCSANKGVMHACGHDAHTSVLMCLAEYFSQHKELIKGEIRFLFQQAEEKGPGGAYYLVEDKALDGVDCVFAWHVAPELELGQIASEPGVRTLTSSHYNITIQGKGGHGGSPFGAIDPIAPAALTASAIMQIGTQEINPKNYSAITVSYINGGQNQVYNIIPDKAFLQGNARTYDTALLKNILKRIEEIAKGICAAKRCTCTFDSEITVSPVINDAAMAQRLQPVLAELGLQVVHAPAAMASEDFSRMLEKVPGVFLNIGCNDPQRPEHVSRVHCPEFYLEEDVMKLAFQAMMAVYLEMRNEETEP